MYTNDFLFDPMGYISDNEEIIEEYQKEEQLPKTTDENYDLIIKTNNQKHNCAEIKDFVEKYPSSFLVLPCRCSTILRLDTRRQKRYDIMLVVSLKDALK